MTGPRHHGTAFLRLVTGPSVLPNHAFGFLDAEGRTTRCSAGSLQQFLGGEVLNEVLQDVLGHPREASRASFLSLMRKCLSNSSS